MDVKNYDHTSDESHGDVNAMQIESQTRETVLLPPALDSQHRIDVLVVFVAQRPATSSTLQVEDAASIGDDQRSVNADHHENVAAAVGEKVGEEGVQAAGER